MKRDRLPYSVPWSGGITVNQDIPLTDKWTGFIGGDLNYLGTRAGEFASGPAALRPQFPDYAVVNLRTGAQSASWHVSLYVNNLMNRRGISGAWSTFSQGHFSGDYFGAVIQPRTVGLGATRTF